MTTQTMQSPAPVLLRAVAVFGILFGVITLFAGGKVLFGDPAAREAAGNVVPFVLRFNFAAGFAYIAAGVGLWKRAPWASALALVIAVATGMVLAAFGGHVASGGAYEMRTLVALMGRTLIWIVIFATTRRFFR
ncbi:MAG: hypothetical protein OEZ59_01930 [Deltaproteobacteria bacterium]|nr:hypothetical protein [Deltaproteobacteria bacterium]